MEKGDFKYIIASSSERELVTCEIYYRKEIFGEISQETGNLILEIYPPSSSKWWVIPLEDVQQAIEIGKKHLLGLEN